MAVDFTGRKYMMAESSASTRTSTFLKGSIIFKKGDTGTVMYEVLSGSVGLYLHYGEDNQQLLAVKKTGEFFGEIALLEKRPRTATAVALENDTELEETSSAEGFVAFVRKHPDNLEPILNMMSNRFKQQRVEYFNACEAFAEYKDAVEHEKQITPEFREKIDFYVAEGERKRKAEWEK